MSITREQFHLQIDRLVDTFGDRHFPDQRVQMIWEVVDGLSYQTVIAIVDSFISESKHAPLPVDFKKAVRESGHKARQYALGEIQPKEIAKCWDCGDSGFIRLKRKENFEEWAKWQTGSAPCYCFRGKQLIEAGKRNPKGPIDFGPQFNDRWKNSYEIISAHAGAT